MTRFLDGEDDEDGSPNVEKAVCECDWRLIQERETDTTSEYSILDSISLRIMVLDWEFAHANTVCSSLIESLRGQTPDERYKMTGYTNNSQCVKATGHFESQCCYHNSLYDVFNAAVACCDENIGPQPKGTCGTHDSSDLWKRK